MKKRGLPELKGRIKPYVMAHRGNRMRCPENTITSFRQAVRDGADIIETDLHLSLDGEFMCIHDSSVDRTTGGTGPVSEKTLKELKALNAGHYAKVNERIPTLRETIEVIPDDIALALELKTDAFLDPAVCIRLAKILFEKGILDRTVVLSFSWDRIKTVKSVLPEICAGLISFTRITPPKGPDVLGPYWRLLMANPLYVFLAHLQNQAVCPLDKDPDSHLRFYKFLGCDAVLTDDPAKTAARLRALR